MSQTNHEEMNSFRLAAPSPAFIIMKWLLKWVHSTDQLHVFLVDNKPCNPWPQVSYHATFLFQPSLLIMYWLTWALTIYFPWLSSECSSFISDDIFFFFCWKRNHINYCLSLMKHPRSPLRYYCQASYGIMVVYIIGDQSVINPQASFLWLVDSTSAIPVEFPWVWHQLIPKVRHGG